MRVNHVSKLLPPVLLMLAVSTVGCVGGCGSDGGGKGDDDAVDAGDTTLDDTTVSDASNDVADTGPDEIPLDQLESSLHNLLCEVSWNCPNPVTAEVMLVYYGRFDSLDQCRSGRAPGFGLFEGLPDMINLASGSSIAYDPEKAADCIGEMYARFCSEEFSEYMPPVCEQVFTGQLSEGESCSIDDQCADGLDCETTTECNGTCVVDPPDLCNGVECSEDEYCDGTTCQPKVGEGQPCTSDPECQEGLVCDDALGTASCVERGSRTEGELCDDSAVCAAGHICTSGICTMLDFVGEGETCSLAGSLTQVCKPGLGCLNLQSDGTGTCGALLQESAPCDLPYQCHASYFCGEPSPGDPTVCIPLREIGESCNSNLECESFYCDGGTGQCAEAPSCTL